MTDTVIERRLAAVLAADVASYSRLMGADEDTTMKQWWSHRREIIDPLVGVHGGRIVKLTGDGFLAEFASAMNAVSCALEMQGKIGSRRDDYPDDKRVEFRMGVNLGDIMSDEEDIYGDGVNIAARIEALADPGGVFISGSVYEQIRSKPDFSCDSLGEHDLKNISDPVRVYRVQTASADAPATPDKPAVPADKQPSIAVLPFDNMSGDPEQEYFADGITEDLITDLSKVSGLLVIARNSVFTYKGKAINVPEVCRELGVLWALEGSVRKAGNRVRITAQLIDGATGGHIWADRFDRELDDIFAVQDEVTGEIVAALKLKFNASQERLAALRATSVPEAYDMFLRARELVGKSSPQAMMEAQAIMLKVLEADPDYSTAMAGLSLTYVAQFINQWGDDYQGTFDHAIKWAEKAWAANEEDPMVLLARGILSIWQRRLDVARNAAERLIEIAPSSSEGLHLLGNIENFSGNPRRGIDLINETIRHDPHFPDLNLHVMGQCYFALKEFETAADYFRQRVDKNANTDSSLVFLAGTCGQLGRFDEAREMWHRVFVVNPTFSLFERARLWPFVKPDVIDFLYEGLDLAGIDPGPKPDHDPEA
jgi:adenylate cyclase